MEYYSEFHIKENNILDSVQHSVEHLPVMEELDTLPTAEELNRAIDSLLIRKALVWGGIPLEIIRCAR